MAIIYISHQLQEISEVVDTYAVGQISESEIANLMVGKEIGEVFARERRPRSEVVLRVRNLTRRGFFEDITLDLHQGEVIGLCGLLGFGQEALCGTLYGLSSFDSGVIQIDGKGVSFRSPRQAIRNGVKYVPDDRRKEGLIPALNAEENLTLVSLPSMSHGGLVPLRTQRRIAERLITNLGIKVSSSAQEVDKLSGGNQQKVEIGKCLVSNPKVLILNDPTRGIDVGAKEEVYRIIERLANEGVGILLVSSELEEYVGLCDRVMIFRKGRIVRELHEEEYDKAEILGWMLGTKSVAGGA